MRTDSLSSRSLASRFTLPHAQGWVSSCDGVQRGGPGGGGGGFSLRAVTVRALIGRAFTVRALIGVASATGGGGGG
eukprot:7135412-Prymnesium_polylepis.1